MSVSFKLTDYLNVAEINPPHTFGHISSTMQFGTLGNTKAGDCVVAGSMHEIMVWTRASHGKQASFTEQGALGLYSQVTGWDGTPDDATDTGLDMEYFAHYRRLQGIVDAAGVNHKVLGYAEIKGIENLIKATWVFGAVGVGINFPSSAEEQFSEGRPWSPVAGATNQGGHYIPIVGMNSHGLLVCITWGRLQAISLEFLERYMEQAVAYISPDYLDPAKNLTPELLDLATLQRDLAIL
jgi:hypothetical protein